MPFVYSITHQRGDFTIKIDPVKQLGYYYDAAHRPSYVVLAFDRLQTGQLALSDWDRKVFAPAPDVIHGLEELGIQVPEVCKSEVVRKLHAL